jgi:transcriptional regulator with XRE-family HTH domain
MDMNRTGYTGLDEAVSEEVRALIARTRGVSVKGIAERLGIRRATLSTRVNGHAPFAPSLLAAVAAELGTTASAIVANAERNLGLAAAS